MLSILLHKNICIMDADYVTMEARFGSFRWKSSMQNGALNQQLHAWAEVGERYRNSKKVSLKLKGTRYSCHKQHDGRGYEAGKGRGWAVKTQQWDTETDVRDMNRSDVVYNNLWGCAKTFLLRDDDFLGHGWIQRWKGTEQFYWNFTTGALAPKINVESILRFSFFFSFSHWALKKKSHRNSCIIKREWLLQDKVKGARYWLKSLFKS